MTAIAAAVGALVAFAAIPAHAGVTDNKTLTVHIDGTTAGAAPDAWAGDTNATIAVVLTNTGPSQSLGSANLTVPAPFALVSAPDDTVPGGPVVELRNLNLAPGASTTINLTVDVRQCTAMTPGPFTIAAKQSNDFNGTGNDFFLDAGSDLQVNVVGACRLAFHAQPTDAERNAVVTSVPFKPAAAPVTVEVRDAGDTGRIGSSTPLAAPVVLGFGANPGSATLGGTISASPVAGIASFAPTVNVSAFNYTLVATSSGLVAAPASSAFKIVDSEVDCPAGASCQHTGTATNNGQTVGATFGPGASSVNLLVSLGAADVPPFSCTSYTPPAGTLIGQYLFAGGSGADRSGTIIVTRPNANRPLNTYQICWAAPYDFVTNTGRLASADIDPGDGTLKPGTTSKLSVGVLPDCAKRSPVAPCVSSRSFDKATQTVTITVLADGRDPWFE